MPQMTEAQILAELRARGVTNISKVNLKQNRQTIFSIGGRGSLELNLHAGFATATPEILDAIAALVLNDSRTAAYQQAVAKIRSFPGLKQGLEEARRQRPRKQSRRSLHDRTLEQLLGFKPSAAPSPAPRPRRKKSNRPRPNVATPEQMEFLRQLYAHLNETRFDNRLPTDIPLRLSNRMGRRLGHIGLAKRDGERKVTELALNVDLMLEANDADCIETMIHEMAHIAAWLFHGDKGHGRMWKTWALRGGCAPVACTEGHVARRGEGVRTVTRVPPLPEGAQGRTPMNHGPAAEEALRPAAHRERQQTPSRPEAPAPKPPAPRTPKPGRGGQFSLF